MLLRNKKIIEHVSSVNKRKRSDSENDSNEKPPPKRSKRSEALFIQMNKLEQELVKLESDLINASVTIYDKCSELKARIQLKTEILIGEIKTKNDIHIDIDEELLSKDLQNIIDQIKQQANENLIHKIDQYQIKLDKWFNSKELEKNEVLETINQMKVKIQTWKNLINPGKLMNDQDKNELNSYDTNILAKTIHYLMYSDIEFECIESDSNFGLGHIFETDKLEVNKSNSLSMDEIKESENHKKVKSGILLNGNYFFKTSVTILKNLDSTKLLIFDQYLKKITHQKVLENVRTNSIYSYENKIVFSSWSWSSNVTYLIVLDEFLNILAKTELNYQIKLAGLDKSNISCFNKEGKIIAFDWLLNKLDSNFKLQMNDSNAPFYMNQKKDNMLIFQFGYIHNRYFVKIDNKLYVFDEFGKTLKIIELKRHFKFVFDSSDNLIILQNNHSLHFHDLNGNLVKKCDLINIEDRVLDDFNIDSNDKLTFIKK